MGGICLWSIRNAPVECSKVVLGFTVSSYTVCSKNPCKYINCSPKTFKLHTNNANLANIINFNSYPIRLVNNESK